YEACIGHRRQRRSRLRAAQQSRDRRLQRRSGGGRGPRPHPRPPGRARSRDPRSDVAGDGRVPRAADAARRGPAHADSHPHGLRRGEAVLLTPKEYELLVALIKRRGAVASRVELLTEVWGYDSAVVSRTVDTHVAELRRKLEDDLTAPRHILTVRKAGYRLER